MNNRHVPLRIVAALALAGVLVISPQTHPPTASALTVFSDTFSSATFAAWTGTINMSIDPGTGRAAPPSARAQATSSQAFAYKVLPTALETVCMSANVNVTSRGTGLTVALIRLRTASSTPIARVYLSSAGILTLKSDVSGVQRGSGVALGTGWHGIELCGTVGTSGSWDLYRDGTQIVNGWLANTGTTPVGRVEIGDNGAKTFTINFDDVLVTDTHQAADTDPPTTPGRPTGTSPEVGSIKIDWAASQDASPPVTYRVYRDGGSTPIGSTTATTYTDTGLVPESSHTYAVDAVDSLDNPASAKSQPSAAITVQASSPIFSDTFTTGDFSKWTGIAGLTIDPGTGRAAPPSARAQATSSQAFAYKVLPTALETVCMSANVNVTSRGTGLTVALIRLRTASSTPIARVYLSSAGILTLKSDVSGVQRGSGVALGTGWHGIELCGTVGTSGSWDLYRDGTQIVNGWLANTGTTPVGRVEIGDNGAKTFTINFDDVLVTGPSVVPSSAPNILIFLTDDQRASDTVIPSVMPKLRQWLMAGGREFTNFFDSTPLCCPDRSVILSGRYAHNTGVRTNTDFASLDQSLTMERLLDADGYETAYVGKFLNDWNLGTKPPYFDHRSLVGGGYTDQTWNIDGVGVRYPDYTTDFAGQRATTYLDHFETNDQQPWAMFVATPAPHNPWTPAAKYANADVGVWAGNPATAETDRSDKPPWVQARNFSLAQVEAVRTPQLRTLKSVDDMVDTVMTKLQELGELTDTLAIYTSDNGYLWGEHRLGGDYGLAVQKRYPYTDSVRLPLFMRWDGHIQAGTSDARLTATVDIVPTVLQAAGIQADYPLDGHSMLSSFSRTRILLEYWLDPGDASVPTWVSLRTASVQFVEYYDAYGAVSFREYYDLTDDPWQLVNLLHDTNPSDPDITQLVTQVRHDAACVGNTEMDPVPANPCP